MMRTLRSCLYLLALSPCASAQVQLFEILGEKFSRLTSVRTLGDVDQDGVLDLNVGADNTRHPDYPDTETAGSVEVRSGVDGHLLLPTIYGDPGMNLGLSIADVGDWDLDGTPDFAAGSRARFKFDSTGQARVYSGRTGQLLSTLDSPAGITDKHYGDRLYALGDLDLDGWPELIVAHESMSEVFIRSAPDGEILRIHRETDSTGNAGTGGIGAFSAQALGDLDGDGAPEYALGWTLGDGAGKSGLVVVYSGKTGMELLRDLTGYQGRDLAEIGDWNLDGVPDLAAGDPDSKSCTSNGKRGRIRILSGVDLSTLVEFPGPLDPYQLGGCYPFQLDGGHDVNGDGVGDLLALNPNAYGTEKPGYAGGVVTIVSGATGTMLWHAHPGGWGSSLLGDLDGDGLSEWGFGDQTDDANGLGAGKVTVFRGDPGDAQRVCVASPNSYGTAAQLSFDGPISTRNNDLRLVIEGGVPNEMGWFFYGPELIQQPFGDGILCAGPGTIGLHRVGPPVQLDADGFVFLQVDMQVDELRVGPRAWLAGSTWTVQFLYRDPAAGGAGFNLSDAMRVTWTP